MSSKLNILLLTIGYPPGSIGGTEVYVQALAQELVLQGHRVTVVIPSENENARSDELPDVREIPLASFRDFISATQFDVVHAHPLTASQFLQYLQVCQHKEIPIVVTYHTPTLTCGRGDLLLNGQEPCDGEVRQRRCAACILQQKGLPVSVGRVLVALPGLDVLETFAPAGKLRSMFSIPRQVRQSQKTFQQLRGLVFHWVAVSKWVKKVLEINGILKEKITVCRQAFCHEQQALSAVPELDLSLLGSGLRVGFIGRIHPYKGLHILLKVLRYLPTANIEIHIVGDTSDISTVYQKQLEMEVCGDMRVKWWGKLDPKSVPAFLNEIDVLVVPSLWMETGPMTVLEAWAAGTPIIGSDRGGIKEWVNEHGGGWLFPPGDVCTLAKMLGDLLEGRKIISPVRERNCLPSIQYIARLMTDIYKKK